LPTGLLNHPLADRIDGTGRLGNRNERPGQQQPARGLGPAQQTFDADDPARGELDLRW